MYHSRVQISYSHTAYQELCILVSFSPAKLEQIRDYLVCLGARDIDEERD